MNIKEEIRILNQIKHKTSPNRRVTKIERRIGELKKQLKEESMKNFTEEEAVRKLTNNKIKVDGKTIYCNKGIVGIKLWSYIDYLVANCNYKRK